MAGSNAKTPAEYIAQLPDDRRETVSAVRDLVLRNLPKGYEESINWGMLSYEIPLERYPDTYNGQPLGYVGIASRKNYITLYLMGAYAIPGMAARLEKAFRVAGRTFDMGKSCLHFRRMEDLEQKVVAEVIAAVPVKTYIEHYEASRRTPARKKRDASARVTAKKSAVRKSAVKKSGVRKGDAKKSSTRSASDRSGSRKDRSASQGAGKGARKQAPE